MKRVRVPVLLGALLLVGVSACGGDNSGTTGSGSGGSGGGGGMTVSIAEPSDGASVQLPFQLKVNSSVPLGSTKSGMHHVHVFFDGNDSKYDVVETDTVELSSSAKSVAGLSPGQHELNVSLRNANHSPAGADTKIMVQVGGSGGSGGSQPSPTTYSGGGGGY